MKVHFEVPGPPVAKGRPRVTRFGTYTPAKTRNYEALVRWSWQQQSGITLKENVPIKIIIKAFFPIPESYSKRMKMELPGKPHDKLPDLDNCIKAICDGIQGFAFKNDSRIYAIEAIKLYSDNPRVEVFVEEYQSEEKT